MLDRSNGILKLINQGKTNNEICDTYNLSNQDMIGQLAYIYQKYGLKFDRNFCSDGNIFYTLNKDLFSSTYVSDIYTRIDEVTFRALAISNLCIGGKLMNIETLHRTYDYCKNNGIHIIFLAGNLVDDIYNNKYNITNPLKQINYLVNKFPYDKNILVHAIGGKSDANLKMNYGIDLKAMVESRRLDIKIASYGDAIVRLKKNKIALYSPGFNEKLVKEHIQIVGNKDAYSAFMENNNLIINVPSLSQIPQSNNFPSALELNFRFANKSIKRIDIKYLNFVDTVRIIKKNSFVLDTSNYQSIYCDNEYGTKSKIR